MTKSTKRRFYKGYCFHYSKIRECYMIFHSKTDGYFLCDTMNETIKETKQAIDKIYIKNK